MLTLDLRIITNDESARARLLQAIARLVLQSGAKLDRAMEMPETGGNPWQGVELTPEELFALPDSERVRYYAANGGVLAVMQASGRGLSQEDIDAWERQQDEEDLAWEQEYKRRYGRELPG